MLFLHTDCFVANSQKIANIGNEQMGLRSAVQWGSQSTIVGPSMTKTMQTDRELMRMNEMVLSFKLMF